MKKTKTDSKAEVKKDVAPAEVSHLKSGHKWLAWVTGLTTAWTAVTFILGLCGEVDLPRSMQYLNVWYLVNMGIIAVMACYATVTILRKCKSQIFWSSTTMFTLMLQAVSLVILFFYKQDTAAINAIAMFVWSICWYSYMLLSPAVESDLPARHRGHQKFGEIALIVMILSTVGYGIMMSLTLLW